MSHGHIRLALGFSRHTKIAALSDLACCIWIFAIERAREQLTNGLVKQNELHLIPRMPAKPSVRQKVIDEFTASGLWIPVDGGWQIHDFLEWQDSSVEARKKREAARERMRRLRMSGSQIVRANESEQFDDCSLEQNENTEECSPERSANVRDLTRAPALSLISSGSSLSPDSSALSASSGGPESLPAREAKPRKAAPTKWRVVPADWQPTDEHREIAATRGVDFELELAKFRDHEFRDPKSNANATFRNWLRSARPTQRPHAYVPAPRQPDSGYNPIQFATEVK